MLQEREIKEHVKEVLRKYYQSLTTKKNQRGKLLIDEEMIYNAIREPSRGDVKIVVLVDKSYHVFIESKRHAKSYFCVMNDTEAYQYTDRRPYDYFVSSPDPNQNYNLYIASVFDLNMLDNAKEKVNKLSFYSMILGILKPVGQDTQYNDKSQGEKRENIELAEGDLKWQHYRKLSDLDPKKKELEEYFFGFRLKFRRYKQPEEERKIIILPTKIKEMVGMIARDIYPLNLRNVLRKDFQKDHESLVRYTIQVLSNLNDLVNEKRKNVKQSNEYIKYLDELEKEINYQISLLE